MRSHGHLAFVVALWLVGGSLYGASAQALPPPVLPGLGPGAARAPVDVAQAPWRAVVLVQTEVGGRCTGALIGSRLVLTAAHCLLGRGTERPVQPRSVHVLSGYARGGYDGHARVVSLVTGPGRAAGSGMPTPPLARLDGDWAVLTLDTPLGTPDRVLPLMRGAPHAGTPLMLGGYEQDRAHAMVADLACALVGPVHNAGGSVLLRHSCAATRGASGAPLLARAPDGTWSIVGVASLAGLGTSGGYAVPAVAVDPALLSEIR